MKTATRVILLFMIVLFACLLFDFLALHDIRNDYVSKLVMSRFAVNSPIDLPDWTNTRGEWSIVQISYVVKLIITALSFFLVAVLHRNSKNVTDRK